MMIVADELPGPIAEQLGQIIAQWARQEANLKLILAEAAGTSIKVARVAFRDVKTDSFVTTVGDLLMTRGFHLPKDVLTPAGIALKAAKTRRDQLAHSTWGHLEGQLGIQDTNGNWDIKGPESSRPRVAKKVQPGFIAIDGAYLTECLQLIKNSLDETYLLHQRLKKIRTSLQIRS